LSGWAGFFVRAGRRLLHVVRHGISDGWTGKSAAPEGSGLPAAHADPGGVTRNPHVLCQRSRVAPRRIPRLREGAGPKRAGIL
jgi:hypothetical protein